MDHHDGYSKVADELSKYAEMYITGRRETAKAEKKVNVEKISAVTLKVSNMKASVRFYRDVLGLKLIYGGENASFSSFCTREEQYAVLNLDQGKPAGDWGRLIFYVDDVDACRQYLKEKGFNPESPRDAAWGERYFHMRDPDGHELSFARPLK